MPASEYAPPSLATIGQRLLTLRAERGMSREEVAERLEVLNDSKLARIERGRQSCEVDLLLALAALYSTSVCWILRGEHDDACHLVDQQRIAQLESGDLPADHPFWSDPWSVEIGRRWITGTAAYVAELRVRLETTREKLLRRKRSRGVAEP